MMLFQKQCPWWLCAFGCAFMLTTAPGCNGNGKNRASPQDYDLGNPHRTELGKVLNEVSGVCWSDEDSSLMAVADSKEKIYQLNLKTKKLKDYTDKVVESNSDLEDIVKVDNTYFLLKSKGTLVEVPAGATDTTELKMYEFPLGGTNDFETLYFDPTAEGLVLLCKTCAREKGTGVRTAFRFDLRTRTFDSTSFFTISRIEVKEMMKNADAKFEPSAAAVHPVNKRLYILSSAGRLLVIAGTRGQVLEAYALHPDDFPQAEGIAFAPDGDMYITNEGKFGKPTLLRFNYGQNNRKK